MNKSDTNPPCGDASLPAHLVSLPVETLEHICRQFCLHCRVRHVVEEAVDVQEACLPDRLALSRLSKTCRRLRSIAQPILHHYYYGAVYGEETPDGTVPSNRGWLAFLRTVAERPDLATLVRAYWLASDPPREGLSWGTPGLHQLVQEVQAKLDGVLESPTYAWCDACDMARWPSPLVGRALRTMVRCHEIALPANGSPLSHMCTFSMAPQVKYLTINSQDVDPGKDGLRFGDLYALLSQVPNLEILVIPGFEYSGQQEVMMAFVDWRPSLGGNPVFKLRRLSISGIDIGLLTNILQSCPVLEDLDLYDSLAEGYGGLIGPRSLLPVQQTLRRLCYSVTPSLVQDGNWEEEEDDPELRLIAQFDEAFSSTIGGHLTFSARDLPRLEILEIEYPLLLGLPPDHPGEEPNTPEAKPFNSETWLAALPPLLRVLHVGMVVSWPHMFQYLQVLVQQARTDFPRLRKIRVDVYKPAPEKEVWQMMIDFSQIGISFEAGDTPSSSAPRGMLGPRIGRPGEIYEPCILFPLDEE